MTEIFSADLPPTEVLIIRVMTSQRYASLQTKAYIALIANWYATESFSAALPPAEAPESLNYDITAKNFDQESHDTYCKLKLTLH